MKKMEKIIIMITVIVLLIIIAIVAVLFKKNKKIEDDNTAAVESSYKEQFNEENKIKKIDSNQEYFNVKKSVENYITISEELSSAIKDGSDVKTKEAKEKIDAITPEFVKQKLKNDLYEQVSIKNKSFRIDNIYRSVQTISKEAYVNDTDIYAYIVNGTVFDDNENQKFTLIAILDMINLTYYIVPEEYIEEEKIPIKENDYLSLYTDKNIEDNTYNKFDYISINDQDICKEYINNLKLNAKYDPQYLYEKLDEEYRDKKFTSVDEFKEYINSDIFNIDSIELSKYKVNTKEINEYICLDQYRKIYNF